MIIDVEKIDTGVKIPPSQFKDNLNTLISRSVSLPNRGVKWLKDAVDQLKIDTKRDAPNFKMEMWYLFLDGDILTIRYGHQGPPQIVITEAKL